MILGPCVPFFLVEAVDIMEHRQAIPVLQTESMNVMKLLLIYSNNFKLLYKNSNQIRQKRRKTSQIKRGIIFKDLIPRSIPRKKDKILQNSYEEEFYSQVIIWLKEGKNIILCTTLQWVCSSYIRNVFLIITQIYMCNLN